MQMVVVTITLYQYREVTFCFINLSFTKHAVHTISFQRIGHGGAALHSTLCAMSTISIELI